MNTKRGKLAAVLVSLLIVGVITVAADFAATSNLPPGQAVVVTPIFSFNDQQASYFLTNLSTPSGLVQVYPSSYTIYLSDDQQVDQAALVKLGDSSLADRISSAMDAVAGGLYGNFSDRACSYGLWNGVDVVIGAYIPVPCGGSHWNMFSGRDLLLGPNYSGLANHSGYVIKETTWTGAMGSGYAQYADLELYYSINQLHFGHYKAAVKAFQNANGMWDGYGFADKAFQSSGEYTSYKLAVDLIAFKELMNNSHTEGAIAAYAPKIAEVQTMMSRLQGGDGGVITNYQIANSAIQIPPNPYENGETTSLFVLAE